MLPGLAVNGQLVFTTSEARSSPSHITATKGSSVWLHWNYTYIGDGVHFGGGLVSRYREQTIDINSTFQNKPHTLAKRIGQNGPLKLESSIPAPFNGRVEVISTNSTLVIHNLQYDDSAYLLSSAVTVDLNVGAGLLPNRYNLKPIVSITVTGMKAIIIQLCSSIHNIFARKSKILLSVKSFNLP